MGVLRRAYALLNVKAVVESADEWVIEGIASTPTPDRMDDVVEPLGAKFQLPMPLLLYHMSTAPVGRVEFAKPGKDGIPYRAHIPKVKEPGVVRDRVLEAVHSIQYRLIGAVSIGFQAVAGMVEQLKSGGLRFKEWEWLELSLVTIPANAEATITSIKSLVERDPAACGRQGSPPGDRRPGASGHSSGPPSGGPSSSRSPKGNVMKTLKELRELRATKAARLKELAELFKADDHEATDEENDEYDGLLAEVKELDKDVRVAEFHALNAKAASPAAGGNREDGARSRVPGGMAFVKTQDPDDKFKGQAMTRVLIAKAAAWIAMKEGNFVSAAEIAQQRWGKSHPNLVRYIKAAVAGGGTGSGEWGAELAQSDTRYNGDFVEYLYAQTIFDRLPLRPVPARVHIKGQDGAATGYWVGESKAIPVSKPDFSDVELTPLKVGAIAVCSKELALDSDPSAELWIRDSIAQASGQRVDQTFLSTTAASAGVSPAGILNGLSASLSAGPDAADLRDDVATLLSGFITAKNTMGLVFVTTPSIATGIAMMTNALGQPEHPDVGENGGTLMKKAIYVGDNVGAGDFILLKPSDIWKIGDSGVQLSMSDSAMVEQDSSPTGATDTPTAASATMVSLWQEESIGFKCVRRINFQKRRSSAVAYIGDAAYGSGT
jgi:HK97 family phage major capsid protein